MQEQEKPSKTRQWQERADGPIATRAMEPREIVEYAKTLADSYKCPASDISYDFRKIQDENDSDRDDCMWLIYKMKCVISGKPGTRVIFRLKIPIPDTVRAAGEMARQQQARQGRRRALPAPTPSAGEHVTSEAHAVQPEVAQPAKTETSSGVDPQTVLPETAPKAETTPAPKVRRPAKRK